MVKTKENKKLPFLEGDEVLLKVKPMIDKDDDGFAICLIFMCLFVIFSILTLLGIAAAPILTPILIVIWISSFSFIYLGIKLYDEDLRKKRSILYFMDTKIIVNLGDGFFSHKIKYNEILFKNIDHFLIYDDGIWIFQKRKNEIPYYSGVETEQKDLAYTKNKFIPLYGKEGLKILEKIKNLLIERIPAIQHPHLRYIFISKQK